MWRLHDHLPLRPPRRKTEKRVLWSPKTLRGTKEVLKKVYLSFTGANRYLHRRRRGFTRSKPMWTDSVEVEGGHRTRRVCSWSKYPTCGLEVEPYKLWAGACISQGTIPLSHQSTYRLTEWTVSTEGNTQPFPDNENRSNTSICKTKGYQGLWRVL